MSTIPMYDQDGFEIISANQGGKAFQLLDDETRLKVIVSAVYIIGYEEIQTAGKTNTRYAVGLQFDSMRALRYEDGSETGKYHSWYNTYTFSYNDKATLLLSGLVSALNINTVDPQLSSFCKTAIGQQISARVKHVPFEKEGKKRIVTNLEAFKPVTEKEDFSEPISKWAPHRQIVKRNPNCKVLTAAMAAKGVLKPTALADFVVGPAAPTAAPVQEIN